MVGEWIEMFCMYINFIFTEQPYVATWVTHDSFDMPMKGRQQLLFVHDFMRDACTGTQTVLVQQQEMKFSHRHGQQGTSFVCCKTSSSPVVVRVAVAVAVVAARTTTVSVACRMCSITTTTVVTVSGFHGVIQ